MRRMTVGNISINAVINVNYEHENSRTVHRLKKVITYRSRYFLIPKILVKAKLQTEEFCFKFDQNDHIFSIFKAFVDKVLVF